MFNYGYLPRFVGGRMHNSSVMENVKLHFGPSETPSGELVGRIRDVYHPPEGVVVFWNCKPGTFYE